MGFRWMMKLRVSKRLWLSSSHPPRKGTLFVYFGPDNSLNLKTLWWYPRRSTPDPTAGHDCCEQARKALHGEFGYLSTEDLDIGSVSDCAGLEGWRRLPPLPPVSLTPCLPRLLGHQLQPRVSSQVSGALVQVVSGLMFCIVLWAFMFGPGQERVGHVHGLLSY